MRGHNGPSAPWRIVGWLAAYLVALHAVLSAWATLPSHAAGLQADQLCLASADDGRHEAPPDHRNGHCPGCFLGVAGLPPVVPVPRPFTRTAAAVLPAPDQRFAATPLDRSHLPRGPPGLS